MKSKEEIIELNKKQTEFYNKEDRTAGMASTMWRKLRNGLLSGYRKNYKLKDKSYEQHKLWLGDLSDKKVLDLGCYSGNALSLYLAENSKEYLGIDLSDVAIEKLNGKLDHIDSAQALAIDFLSDDFTYRDFDIVYAFGVMHHFENFDLLIDRITEVMKPGGLIVSYDPLETSPPIVFLRKMYRPFQDDADWEWPFTKSTLRKIENKFKVLEVKGLLGKSKYGIPLQFMPLSNSYKDRVISKWIEQDWTSTRVDDVFNCMHVTMLLQTKKGA